MKAICRKGFFTPESGIKSNFFHFSKKFKKIENNA